MATTTNYIVLVTGANRGIGLGLAGGYLARPHTTVVAAVRDTGRAKVAFQDLPVGDGSELLIEKLDSASETDPATLAADLAGREDIPHLDLVIANAGMSEYHSVLETTSASMRDHFEINALGPLRLFQAVWPPLLSRSSEPKFVIISSQLSSLELAHAQPYLAYGASKVAGNMIVRKIHIEHPTCVALAADPGWVQTDMGQSYADRLGVESPPLTLDESRTGLMKLFDGATRETASGKLVGYDGKARPF